MIPWRLLIGSRGERLAARHLKGLGYRIIQANHRSQSGELDLVAVQGDVLVFCEVKTRSGVDSGHPGEAIDHFKRQQLLREAEVFLQSHPQWSRHACRFDAVLLHRNGKAWRVEVISDAFQPGW
ncbi:MAG: YraN family protein [Magnetococcales bacterium]|nr:YraN family protein [Magnetococcales bacterium]